MSDGRDPGVIDWIGERLAAWWQDVRTAFASIGGDPRSYRAGPARRLHHGRRDYDWMVDSLWHPDQRPDARRRRSGLLRRERAAVVPDGRAAARRAARAHFAVAAESGHFDRGPAFLVSPGHRPARPRTRRHSRCPDGRDARGRQHDHAAARADALSLDRAQRRPQGQGGGHCAAARRAAVEAADPRAVPEPRLSERRYLRRRTDGAERLRQARQRSDDRRVGA